MLTMTMDDPTLVNAVRSGDPQATRLLVERFHGIVFGLCYRMLNHRQDAEDVTQETFLRGLAGDLRIRLGATHPSLAAGDRRQPLPYCAGLANAQAQARPGFPGRGSCRSAARRERSRIDLADELERAVEPAPSRIPNGVLPLSRAEFVV